MAKRFLGASKRGAFSGRVVSQTAHTINFGANKKKKQLKAVKKPAALKPKKKQIKKKEIKKKKGKK
jgi:hypothetical protein